MLNCNPETGVCSLPEVFDKPASQKPVETAEPTVRYIGDPMCSWCWGISPTLIEVASYCQSHGLNFSVHVGGLRPGGGDEWNSSFKAFLRHEWENIHRVTGQPFGFSVLDEAEFNYDTEPACRAVVAMKLLRTSSQVVLAFFSSIQQQFYVKGSDPKQPELGLEDVIPDHSTFSKNRHGRFRDSETFRHLFETVLRRCMAEGLVRGEGFASSCCRGRPVVASIWGSSATAWRAGAPETT